VAALLAPCERHPVEVSAMRQPVPEGATEITAGAPPTRSVRSDAQAV